VPGGAARVRRRCPRQPPPVTKTDARVGGWARANIVELAYTPHYASWLNRIEAQFTALRHFCLDGTDHESHEQTLPDAALALEELLDGALLLGVVDHQPGTAVGQRQPA
jgi:hypothetical protein